MGDDLGAGEKGGERRVMVAIDEGEHSHYALMWVLDNMKESISKSSVFIFMAQPPPNRVLTYAASLGSARMYYPVSASPELLYSVQDNQKKITLAFLEKAKEICASKGVNAEIITDVGDPKTAICSVVEKLNINMLVLGEGGVGKIKRAFIGSVSNYCVHYAKCPVLVVKKP
ncbi:Usp domain-containing protein [Cephalotus follicularis]|uniref:Usp domain-containing protein n=1 Tax=Cephalotus follicularis TaxID=3775 RepID=A0A1Q3BES8_CEPFO|nr:Usp domain-containing protein [Cephalotus follicularis]